MNFRANTQTRGSRRATRVSIAALVVLALGACAGSSDPNKFDTVRVDQDKIPGSGVDSPTGGDTSTYEDETTVDPAPSPRPASPPTPAPPVPAPPTPAPSPSGGGCAADHDYDGICDEDDIDSYPGDNDDDYDGIPDYDDFDEDDPMDWTDDDDPFDWYD